MEERQEFGRMQTSNAERALKGDMGASRHGKRTSYKQHNDEGKESKRSFTLTMVGACQKEA